LANPKYAKDLEHTQASAVIVGPQVPKTDLPLIITANPYLAYARVAQFFAPQAVHPPGISPLASVGEDCRIGDHVSVYPFVYIGHHVEIEDEVILFPGVFVGDSVKIGRGSLIYPNVSILSGTIIGQRVIIHAGTVIGSDGYAFARDGLTHVKIPQVGIVQIDDDCEIGANNTIDRAAMGKTWIKAGVKTDNLVHIAHNVVIGENTLLVAQVGISGSSTLGKGVVLGGQVGVVGHISIGDGVMVGAQSGVAQSIPAGQIVSGYPAMPHQVFLRSRALFQRWPEMVKQLRTLEDRLRLLEAEKEREGKENNGIEQ
jgi:UDP-3-O-[3-hydroxymyristoyl] glucosamine N-acyltransferase